MIDDDIDLSCSHSVLEWCHRIDAGVSCYQATVIICHHVTSEVSPQASGQGSVQGRRSEVRSLVCHTQHTQHKGHDLYTACDRPVVCWQQASTSTEQEQAFAPGNFSLQLRRVLVL